MAKNKTRALLAAALFALFAAASCLPDQKAVVETVVPNEKHTVAYPALVGMEEGAPSTRGEEAEHFESPYYAHPDFYHMPSTETLAILPQFSTYQQTTSWTCGPAAIIMVLAYFGETRYSEAFIAEHYSFSGKGMNTSQVVAFFTDIGWEAVSSPLSQSGMAFKPFDAESFASWADAALRSGLPILVEWVDWGSHWQVLIGYDSMGTTTVSDDVLILADPYDTTDQYQDGYYIFSAERFVHMWQSGDGAVKQPWVIAKPAYWPALP